MVASHFLVALGCAIAGGHTVETADTTTLLPTLNVTAGSKTNVELLPLTTSIVTSAQIEESAESSLLPVLVNRVPGLFVTERGMAGYGVSTGAAGEVNIRGVGQSNKVLFMVDGQPQWAGIFGHALSDTYVANGVERVEVVRGPSSLLYGSNAMGGSVNIITNKAHTDGFRGRAKAMAGSYATQRYALSGALKSGAFEGTAGATFDGSKGNRPGSHFWLANEYLQLGYSLSQNWKLGGNLHMTQSKAHNPGSVYKPLESMWTRIFRGTTGLSLANDYENVRGGLQMFLSWGRHRLDDGWTPGSTPTDYLYTLNDYNMGITAYETLNFWRGNDLSVGFDFQHWGGHHYNDSKVDGAHSADFKNHVNEVAGYVMMQQALLPGDLLSLNAGVRLQHGSNYGNEWVPQAGFVLRPVKSGNLKFSFSKGFRAPNLRELYLYKPANPDLKPEYLLNYDVTWNQTLLNGALDYSFSLFLIDAKDMIQAVMEDGRMMNQNTGKFINKGFEMQVAYRINDNWSADANYSYLRTDKPLLAAPKNKLNAEVIFTPSNFSFTLESNSIWGLYTATGEKPAKESYSLLNFRGAYTFQMKTPLTLSVKVDNITDTDYEIVYGFPMPGITVMAGLELKF